MSYGVWKKRGKGWSSIEIDGAGRDAQYQWGDYAKKRGNKAAESLKEKAIALGVGCNSSIYSDYPQDDFHYVNWATTQLKRGWKVVSCDTQSEHSLWISYEDEEGLKRAMEVLGERVDGLYLLNY